MMVFGETPFSLMAVGRNDVYVVALDASSAELHGRNDSCRMMLVSTCC